MLEYHTEYGTCNVPPLHVYECDLPNMGDDGGSYHYKDNLGKWLHIQRQAKMNSHHGINKITPDQVAQLQLLVDEGESLIHSFHIRFTTILNFKIGRIKY